MSVDPLTAERIGVVRGPASLVYGNQALGGVVNVISNDIPGSIPPHVDGYVATDVESASPGGGVAAGVTVPLTATLKVLFTRYVWGRRLREPARPIEPPLSTEQIEIPAHR